MTIPHMAKFDQNVVQAMVRADGQTYCSITPGITTRADDHVGAPGQPREPPRPQLLGTTSGTDPSTSELLYLRGEKAGADSQC
jgi:hypothetical protein